MTPTATNCAEFIFLLEPSGTGNLLTEADLHHAILRMSAFHHVQPFPCGKGLAYDLEHPLTAPRIGSMNQPSQRVSNPARSAPQNLPFRLTAVQVPAENRDTPTASSKDLGGQSGTEESGLQ